jgi:predicted lipoprotein with Yx(FWY)xxD motif
MVYFLFLAVIFAACFLAALPGKVRAWSNNPYVNTPICMASDNQERPQITSDGAGGAIITWWDYRNGASVIYAQRVDSSGTPQWSADGVPICTATSGQGNAQIISDGAGGAIITWDDYRSGNWSKWDIFAQRVSASGTPQWTSDGVAICTAWDSQLHPQIISDGAGGVIITWRDYRSGNADIYARRVTASGTPQWSADGVPICMASGHQWNPHITSDGSGGAIISWEDYRGGWSNCDIYAQQIGKTGILGKTHRSLPFLPLLLLE